MLLLDTHVAVWLVDGLPRLRPAARRAIDRAAARGRLIISAISFWEVALLARRDRLALTMPALDWRRAVLALPGLTEAPVSSEIAIEAISLPDPFHADPADRFIVATARLEGARLVTYDRRILDYGRAGHVQIAAP